MNKNLEMSKTIARRVRDAGGDAYYVGGFVRDALLGIPTKDIDMEIHNLEPSDLDAILDSLGERLSFGASFGITTLKSTSIDIALPRRERKNGEGHRGFDVEADPYLGTLNAAKRRDFTVNSLMQDVLSEEIIDHFGGKKDLADKVLRHIDDKSFPEDPLRVLRGAQFAARFGFTVAPETVKLCGEIDLSTLARERVRGELMKALMQAEEPSRFFHVLKEMGQLSPWFMEIEGEEFSRGSCVLDQAAKRRKKAEVMERHAATEKAAGVRKYAQHPEDFMLLALYLSFSDERKGAQLLKRLFNMTRTMEYVDSLSISLAKLKQAVSARTMSEQSTRRIIYGILRGCMCPEDLILIYEASAGDEPELWDILKAYEALMEKPWITGADLIAAGFEPGRRIGGILKRAEELRLDGVSREEALQIILAE